jgi:sn-glycerol 3-phosphate transport system substrate-binding protein
MVSRVNKAALPGSLRLTATFAWGALCALILLCTFHPLVARGLKQGPLELTFWHSMSLYQSNTLETLVERYNQTREDTRIRPVFQGLYLDMITKLISASKTGDLPDIAQIAIEYLDVFIESGKLEPISFSLSPEDRADILPQFWSGVTRGREIYAFPFNQSVQVLYYNKDAFEKAGLDPGKPPKTWADVIEYGRKLTLDTDGDGAVDRWGVLISLEGVFGLTPLIRQVGGEFLDEGGRKVLFDGKAGVRVMSTVQDMVYKHAIMPSNWTLFEGTNAFLQGKIAMGPITCAGIKFAEQNLPWRLGIAPLPYFENKSVLLGGAGLAVFSKSSYRKKAALDFISWLTNRENTILWHEQTGYLPIRKSAIESLELKSFYAEHPNYKVPVDQLPYARTPDFTPYLPQLDKIVRTAIESIMVGGNDPGKTLRAAAERANELFAAEVMK